MADYPSTFFQKEAINLYRKDPEFKEIFNNGETVICENKMRRHVSRSALLSQELGWRIEGDKFKNDDYERDFHTSRCIEFDGIVPK